MFSIIVSILSFLAALAALLRATADRRLVRSKLQSLEAKRSTLECLLRRRGELASEIAHEIKNPITAILCSAEALEHLLDSQLDETNRRTLRYIKEYGDNLLKTVSDFIDLSRAEAGRIEVCPAPTRVIDGIEAVLGILRAHAERRQLTLRVQSSDESTEVYIDPIHFKQILFNIVHNAIKFTDQGEITVTVYEEHDSSVKIAVSDTGMGIPAVALPHLFDPYSQVDSGPKKRSIPVTDEPEFRSSVGAGLGLALTKELIELARGRISVDSREGVGSIFVIELPAISAASSPEKAHASQTAGEERTPAVGDADPAHDSQPLAGQRVLLIDGDDGVRDSIARLIQSWGGMVDQVDAAFDAIEALTYSSYDTIMIDRDSSGGYTRELARLVRHGLGDNETKIILAADEEFAEVAELQSTDGIIQKPISGRKLLACLRRNQPATLH